jgi:predicted TIM-barrel enzyme
MCNACVMEGVKQSMLSRRSLFAGAAATGLAAAAAGIGSARPALAQAAGRGPGGRSDPCL